jgi:hypothetical protein
LFKTLSANERKNENKIREIKKMQKKALLNYATEKKTTNDGNDV